MELDWKWQTKRFCLTCHNKKCGFYDQNEECKCRKTYLSFIDYTKWFAKVKCEELLEMWGKPDLHGKDIAITPDLYWKQTACKQIENELSTPK